MEYDATLKCKTEKDPAKYDICICHDDCIANTCRVCECRCVKHPKLSYFFLAARLVAIIPTSSDVSERVFSRVKHIFIAVGEYSLDEIF